MSMKFYNLNPDLDLDFYKISTKLNLAYWITADLYIYAESSKEDINEYEFERMLNQYSLAAQVFHEAEDLIQFIKEGDHKKCLLLLTHYIQTTMIDNNIHNIFTPKLDSEKEEIEEQEMINRFDEYIKEYTSYLIPNTFEYNLSRSFKYLTSAISAASKLHGLYEFNFKNQDIRLCEDIIDNFMSARILLDQAFDNTGAHEQIKNEFHLSISENKQALYKENLSVFYNLVISYINLWREFFYVNEQFYKDLLTNNFKNQEELFLINHYSEQYMYMIHKIAIEVNILILNNMEMITPNIEIYSARKIKSPIDHISKRYRYN